MRKKPDFGSFPRLFVGLGVRSSLLAGLEVP